MKQDSALKSPVYRRFLAGSLLSSIGDHVGMAALNWYVLETTSSAVYLGIINFFRLLPALFIGLAGGWLADRFPRRKLMIFLYIPIMGLSLALALYVSSGHLQMSILCLLVVLKGLFEEMEPPVRNALLPEMVLDNALASGVALYTTMLNVARIIGPALAGLVIAQYGTVPLFFFHTFSQLAVFLTLFAIPKQSDKVNTSALAASTGGYREVVRYLRTQPFLLTLFLVSISFMLFGFPYSSLVPVFVQNGLGKGPETFGYLLTATAIGAVLGALGLTRLDTNQQIRFIPLFACCFSVMFVLLGLSHSVWLAGILLFFIGLFSQAFRTSIRIVFQLAAPEHMRGRLMSVILADRGFIPIGILLASKATESLGIGLVFQIMGGCCLLSLIPFLFHLKKRTASWSERSDSACN